MGHNKTIYGASVSYRVFNLIVLKCAPDKGWVIYLKLVGSHLHNDQKRGEDQSLGKEYKTTFI